MTGSLDPLSRHQIADFVSQVLISGEQAPRDPSLMHLLYLRELATLGDLEHEPFGPPGGTYANLTATGT